MLDAHAPWAWGWTEVKLSEMWRATALALSGSLSLGNSAVITYGNFLANRVRGGDLGRLYHS